MKIISNLMKFFEQMRQSLKIIIKLVEKANYKFNIFGAPKKKLMTVLGEPGKNAERDDSFALREVAVQEGPL